MRFDCRSRLITGHKWTNYYRPADVSAPDVAGYHIWVICENCETIRVTVISATTGKTTYRRYIYPNWYKRFRPSRIEEAKSVAFEVWNDLE